MLLEELRQGDAEGDGAEVHDILRAGPVVHEQGGALAEA